MVDNIKTKWVPTCNRFVGYLDILGFKDLVMRTSHQAILEKLIKINNSKDVFNKLPKFYKNFGDAEMFIVTFSDSMYLFSKNDNEDNFTYFLKAIKHIFGNAILNGIPLKGGFAYGEISVYIKKRIYFGQPIIDANSIGEEANYLGVVAHNSIDKYIANTFFYKDAEEDLKRNLFEEKIPLKSGNIYHRSINWFNIPEIDKKTSPKFKIKDDINENFRLLMNNLMQNTSGSPRRYIDNTIDVFKRIYSKE